MIKLQCLKPDNSAVERARVPSVKNRNVFHYQRFSVDIAKQAIDESHAKEVIPASERRLKIDYHFLLDYSVLGSLG